MLRRERGEREKERESVSRWRQLLLWCSISSCAKSESPFFLPIFEFIKKTGIYPFQFLTMPQNWFDYGKCHYLPHIWCQNIFTTEYNAKTWIDYDIFFSLFLSLSPWCPNLIALHCTVILFLLPPLFPAGHEGFSSDPPPLHLFAWQDNHLDDIYLLAGQQGDNQLDDMQWCKQNWWKWHQWK